ncbi:MAG: dTMP kinase [Planctomycetota bacterium]|nr:dTMP kinase [Planctomycetota bacterium]MDI6787782.1 dTMP kinase [Planctomycetota bacterium]
MRRGKFIVIDGPDGCGKSTQAGLLEKYLRSKGYSVLVARDPGSTSISENIRKILLNPRYKEMTSLTEMFLYFASRVQLVEEVIRKALQDNKIVICDRFLSSTIVYQGYAGGIGANNVRRLWHLVRQIKADMPQAPTTGGFEPDLTIILDIRPEIGFSRIAPRRGGIDRMEQKTLLFHKKVRDGFIRLTRSNRKLYRLIDASDSIEEVQNKIREVVEKYVL